jgi:hypothetical protein
MTSAIRTQRTKQARTTTTAALKKWAHNVHYHDGCCHGSNGKLLVSCASHALSDGDFSANKSNGNCTLENYHLDSFHILQKRSNVGHKSPENNALVEAGVYPNLDAIFHNDVTVDSFLKAFQDNPGLSICDTNDGFKFKN